MRTFRNIASMTAVGALSASMFAFAAAPAGAVAPPEDSKRFEQSYYAGDDQGKRLTWSDEWRGNVTLPEVWGQRHAASPPQDRYAAPGADARLAEQWQRGHGLWRDQYADARRTMSERDWRAYQDEMRWREQAARERDMRAWQDDMHRRQEEAFRRGYEAGRAYERGGERRRQESYDPWRMREYTGQWDYRAPGWEAREGLSPQDYGAWRDNGADYRREFRAAPGAAPGNYRSEAPGLRDGGGDRRTFQAYPGIESGNYR